MSIMADKKILPLIETISFAGKKVLVTGASSGIGKAEATRFAEAGAELILIDRSDTNGVPDYLSMSPKVTHYKVDLGKREEIDAFWEKLTDEQLPDVIINNAGIYPQVEFTKVDEKFYDLVMEVNMNSVFWMCQHFVGRRGTNGGIIVNTSSIEAAIPFTRDLIHYGMGKAGIVALTRGIAREFGRKGFRANAVMPGGIMTEGTNKEKWNVLLHVRFDLIKTGIDFQNRIANGVWGAPDDVAKAVIFLASDLASYIQGVVLPVDGGFLAD